MEKEKLYSELSAREKAAIFRSWLEEHRAKNAAFFDLLGTSPLAEVVAVVSATSLRHARSLADGLLELCKERGITPNGLANISAVPQATIKSILNGESQNPGTVTIKKLCDGFEITLGEFFSTPEFDSLEQEII